MAEGDALSYCPVTIVPESKLSHMATDHYGFVPKLSLHEWKNPALRAKKQGPSLTPPLRGEHGYRLR